MAYTSLLFYFIFVTLVLQGVSGQTLSSRRGQHLKVKLETSMELVNTDLWRRSTVGSVMPSCTINECRRCRLKCRAEQVPVEGNDPINSAYHYRCVCHR